AAARSSAGAAGRGTRARARRLFPAPSGPPDRTAPRAPPIGWPERTVLADRARRTASSAPATRRRLARARPRRCATRRPPPPPEARPTRAEPRLARVRPGRRDRSGGSCRSPQALQDWQQFLELEAVRGAVHHQARRDLEQILEHREAV